MITPWKEIQREQVFKKYSRTIMRVDFRMPDGSISDFYIKNEKPAVATVALTSDNEIILVEQFRPGPQKIFLELPGGYVNDNEPALESAKRELLEETGYTGDFEQVTTCFDDAYSTMVRTVVIARNCSKINDQALEQHEYADVHLVSIDEFRNILRSGKMTDVEVGYLGLDYLNLL
ncbi:NUDIX hydrolase [bacterium]|uniref:ADP-ribose pyrophosphatase n=1 Tax=candidate division WWE3 bacterium CG22_combo_CG10-13_8_21_14_all_39_12 TaxID=1975094 RepID=A0A2H0BG83_UNCKA|nr:NUDIX hydrolase [bacterium]PIP56686.1 MAG: ADP-ribose pyrophosphatase [candidate division WWE3 bacterium CG22_combo_CG10-13_8_21_14_all_39_12]